MNVSEIIELSKAGFSHDEIMAIMGVNKPVNKPVDNVDNKPVNKPVDNVDNRKPVDKPVDNADNHKPVDKPVDNSYRMDEAIKTMFDNISSVIDKRFNELFDEMKKTNINNSMIHTAEENGVEMILANIINPNRGDN